MFYGEFDDEYENDKMFYPDVFEDEEEDEEELRYAEVREDFGYFGEMGLWD